MKVLLYDTTFAFLTPGGKTTHAVKLQKEISKLGVDIQFTRWWDKTQEDADIIHFLTPDERIARLAKQKGMKTFFSMIFDYESNKSESEKKKTIIKNKVIDLFPSLSSSKAYWKSLKYMDKVQFMHKYDKETALRYFPTYLKSNQIVEIPHAYDPEDMNISADLNIADMHFPDKYLISVANISQRKQTIKLAQLAKSAQTPIVFLGSRSVSDPYFQAFEKEIDNKYVFYPGYVSKEWRDCIEKNASGYVLLSLGESGCIAVYEAAAYNMPLLLSNLPWAWGYESPQNISLCDQNDWKKAECQLKDFYKNATKLDHQPFSAHTWSEVASMYVEQYNKLLL